MNEVSIDRLIAERQTKFIETRTIIEKEVDTFLQSLEKLDNDVQARCKVVPGTKARDILPALWVEPFNEQVYNEQLAKLQNYIAGVKSICDELNKEAMLCLQQ